MKPRRKQKTPGKDRTPPVIQMRNMETDLTTYLDQVFIEGNVRDSEGVKHLLINEKQILRAPGRKIWFSHLAGLENGENTIAIQGTDISGNSDSVLLRIRREVLSVRGIGSRLSVVVNPFVRKSVGENRQLSYGFEGILTPAMLRHGRFALVERQRIKAILEELRLNESGLVDEDTALKVGKILAADCMLFGSVLERANSIEIYARLVDTETSEILAAVDLYGEDVDIGVLRTLSKGLNLKLADELPVAEGIVMRADGRRIAVDLGTNKRVKKGMKLIVYQLGNSIRDPKTGRKTGRELRELGRARIESVTEEMSFADLNENTDSTAIKPMLHVITR